MSSKSAMLRQLSIAAGVVPQSSCSFKPTAPASIISLQHVSLCCAILGHIVAYHIMSHHIISHYMTSHYIILYHINRRKENLPNETDTHTITLSQTHSNTRLYAESYTTRSIMLCLLTPSPRGMLCCLSL